MAAPAKELEILCMTVTPMRDDYTLDEAGLRAHLRRLIAARNGIYLGSGGSGEGHALTAKELRRLYEIGVEEAKGKVPIYANPRESRTAAQMLEICQEAVSAGIDMVQVYQLDGGHGMTPTVREQEAYFTTVLDGLNHPVALSVHVVAGYLAPIALLKTLCSRYQQIRAINVMGPPDRYFMQLRDALPESVRLYTNTLVLPTLASYGAVGALGTENNVIPSVCQAIGDGIVAGDVSKVAQAMQTVQRFAAAVAGVAPEGGSARRSKMALKALGLGNGVLRPPYMQLPDAEQQKLAATLTSLRIRELEGL